MLVAKNGYFVKYVILYILLNIRHNFGIKFQQVSFTISSFIDKY